MSHFTAAVNHPKNLLFNTLHLKRVSSSAKEIEFLLNFFITPLVSIVSLPFKASKPNKQISPYMKEEFSDERKKY